MRFAYIEHHLSMMIYSLLKINPKQGRIAVRNPRLKDKMEMIEDLCGLANIKLDIKNLTNNLDKLEIKRNYVAHNIWVKDSKTRKIYLRVTKGNWPKKPHGNKTKRIIQPQAADYDLKTLRYIAKNMDIAIRHIKDLELKLEKAFRKLHKASK